MNPSIGECLCPVCLMAGTESRATVHRESGRRAALYIRCDQCGTIQPRMSGGQANMRKIARFFAAGPEQDQAAAEAAELAKETAAAAIQAERRQSKQPPADPKPQPKDKPRPAGLGALLMRGANALLTETD